MKASLALLVEVHQLEAETPHELQVVVQDADGQRTAEARGGFQIGGGSDMMPHENYHAPMSLDLREAPLPSAGSYSIEIMIDGAHQRTLNFQAMPAGQRPDQAIMEPPPQP